MPADDSSAAKQNSQNGRNMWDVIAAAISNPIVLTIFATLLVVVVVLLVAGKLQIINVNGHLAICTVCPQLPSAATAASTAAVSPASAQPSSTPSASASTVTANSDMVASAAVAEPPVAASPTPAVPKTLLASVLNVPIYSTWPEAEATGSQVHHVTNKDGGNALQYRQTFLGLNDASVTELLSNEGVTQNAQIEYGVTHLALTGYSTNDSGAPLAEVNSACSGEKYNQFVDKLVDNFGMPKNRPSTTWNASDEISSEMKFTNGILCGKGEMGVCSKNATKTRQSKIFDKMGVGTMTFTATLTTAARMWQKGSDYTWYKQTETSCNLESVFEPAK